MGSPEMGFSYPAEFVPPSARPFSLPPHHLPPSLPPHPPVPPHPPGLAVLSTIRQRVKRAMSRRSSTGDSDAPSLPTAGEDRSVSAERSRKLQLPEDVASALSIQLSGPSGRSGPSSRLGSSVLPKLPSQPIAIPRSSASVAAIRLSFDGKGSSSTTLPIIVPMAGSFTGMRGRPSDNSFTSRSGVPITNSFTSRVLPAASSFTGRVMPAANSFTNRGYLPTSFSRMSRAALGIPAPKPEARSSIPGILITYSHTLPLR